MKYYIIVLLFILLLFGCGDNKYYSTQQPIYHVLILAGQSNMVGVGSGNFDSPDNVMFYNSGDVIPNCFGPEVGLWNNLNTNDQWIIIKYAIGGTEIHQWNETLLFNLISSTQEVLSKFDRYQFDGFLWLQGEGDVVISTTYTEYYDRFTALTETIFDNFGLMNVYIAQIQFGSLNNDIKLAQEDYAYNNLDTYIFSTEDLTTIEGIHFDTESQLTIGKRFAILINENITTE